MKQQRQIANIPADIRASRNPEEILAFALKTFHPRIVFASSFSLEDIVIIDILMKLNRNARVFALDTGRLDPETYECAQAIQDKYQLKIEWHFPQQAAVETIERKDGLFSFKASVQARKHCCHVRKVAQMHRALDGVESWITGLRKEQSTTRVALEAFELDGSNGDIIKVNPLTQWTLDDVWNYVKKYRLPYNILYDQGYQSIGCAPCTRAVKAGESERAGRWWWENPEHKECGIHIRQAFCPTKS